ncbi:MAG: transcriptional regulator TetR family [Clostridiales bacterium]|jgi:AcrR family transcriptional regulator|nr:transcriptional regulator TetR family [Clostridiales bacterium]
MKGSKKENLIQFNKQNILLTARKLFVEKGVYQTTMDDIAREANYSKSTIYVYFKSKDEIYNHIVYENMNQLKQGLEEGIQSSSNFEDCYYTICNTLVSFQEKYPLYFESILGEISIDQESFEKMPILRDIYMEGEEINKIIENFLQNAIDNNYIRQDIEVMPTVLALWASICGIISFASKKEVYLQADLKCNKQKFLENGFGLILQSIIR